MRQQAEKPWNLLFQQQTRHVNTYPEGVEPDGGFATGVLSSKDKSQA